MLKRLYTHFKTNRADFRLTIALNQTNLHNDQGVLLFLLMSDARRQVELLWRCSYSGIEITMFISDGRHHLQRIFAVIVHVS